MRAVCAGVVVGVDLDQIMTPFLSLLTYISVVNIFVYQGVNIFRVMVGLRVGLVAKGGLVVVDIVVVEMVVVVEVVVVGSYEWMLHLGRLSVITALRTIPVSGFGSGIHGFGSSSDDLRVHFMITQLRKQSA